LQQDASDAFFDRALQYYVAGRFAFHAGQTPVAANLLHHAVEMCLKEALSRNGLGLKQLRDLGHELPPLWEEYKRAASDRRLNRFDAAISDLNDYEELRYPDRMLKQGMGSLFVLKRSHAANIPGAAVTQYVLNLEDVDETRVVQEWGAVGVPSGMVADCVGTRHCHVGICLHRRAARAEGCGAKRRFTNGKRPGVSIAT